MKQRAMRTLPRIGEEVYIKLRGLSEYYSEDVQTIVEGLILQHSRAIETASSVEQLESIVPPFRDLGGVAER